MAAATPAAHGLVNSTFIPIDTRLGQRAVDFRAQLGFATRVQKAGVEGRLHKLAHITQRETHLTHEHAVLARDVGAKGQGVSSEFTVQRTPASHKVRSGCVS